MRTTYDWVGFEDLVKDQRKHWRFQAACLEVPTSTFYGTSSKVEEEAKSICSICPVRIDCLTYALATREESGIWGGATEKERKRIIRRVKLKQPEDIVEAMTEAAQDF